MWFRRKAAPTPPIRPVSAAPPAPHEELRSLLFADQSLNNLFKRAHEAREEASPNGAAWMLLDWARDHIANGRASDARGALHEVLKIADLDTRVRLWTWTALRKLGEVPRGEEGSVPRGVVIEIPMPRGLETLAIYDDRSCRYINHGGGIVVWDSADPHISTSAQNIFKIAGHLFPTLPDRTHHPVPQAGYAAITILAYSGSSGMELAY